MKFLIRILEKIGFIPSLLKGNQPCYDKYGRFIGWFSRSMAVALFTFCKNENGEWCVLASERGEEAADFQGYWNSVCGYLDYSETTKEAAVRECFEETGVKIDPSTINFFGYEDSPSSNHQNVTFRFYTFISDKTTNSFVFSKKNNEGKEVGLIKWLPIDEIENYQWAFGHKGLIKEVYEKYKPKN